MKALAFILAPDTNNTGLITTTPGAIAIIVTLMNTGGTGTIIGTIMIGTTTQIDASLFFLPIIDWQKARYEIITFFSCVGHWRIEFSIL